MKPSLLGGVLKDELSLNNLVGELLGFIGSSISGPVAGQVSKDCCGWNGVV